MTTAIGVLATEMPERGLQLLDALGDEEFAAKHRPSLADALSEHNPMAAIDAWLELPKETWRQSNYGFATTDSGSLRERISTACATISSTTSRAGLISPMSPAT